MRSRKQTERRQLLMESSLACRRGMEGISSKAEGIEEGKLERRKDPWEPRDWDTRTHLKKELNIVFEIFNSTQTRVIHAFHDKDRLNS
ncbi:hypothetical protein AVEN_271742-1 [Araneus ventricosus]|uniref:Uncharacterized protein n=1 Tax=Araneus ventricosus TaxID=182803 RepID=A0A4Y2SNH6_ARAVE|nr:hypothetical protein AVEN_250159-1 [Araneus ventricosus]GBN89276.1 hypothetical protein AVEN_232977-1 [Araneus ventricosus]GBN90287.1 hypothetical protein AVEN_176899-1 [Araneus ventricosus]GBN90307.1 hypothetical protein AVEN_271742-1 [Araneus ventricosus]